MSDYTYPIQFSYTLFSSYEICPEQARRVYVVPKGERVKKTYSRNQDSGIDVHKALELRVKQGSDLPPQLAHVEPLVRSLEARATAERARLESEVSLGINHLAQPVSFWDAYLRGKYDVVIRGPTSGKAFIGDWKDGRIKENDAQLEIGAVLLMVAEPAIDTVVGVNLWVGGGEARLGTPYKFTRGGGHAARWFRLMNEIDRLDPTRMWALRDGPLCPWCPVKDCVHHPERGFKS